MSFLGIDVGTSGTKALVLSARDSRGGARVLGVAESPHALLTPRPGWTEQNPADWWAATVLAVRAALRQASRARGKGKPRGPVMAIGLSGQMHGSVFMDKAGAVLRPAILWNDQRTADQCAQIERLAGGRRALIDMVSNPALTGFTAPKILWFREHEPRKFDRCAQVLLPKDYLRYRLTGAYATDVSDASGTLLLDVKNRAWHTGLMERLEMDPALFPRVGESQEVTGTLTADAARSLGLPPGIPVVGGGGDQAAGAVGTGVVESGLVSAAMGTSGVIFAASGHPRTDPEGRVHTMCHAVPKMWCVFGCMLSAGGSLQWLRNTLFAAEMAKTKDAGQIYPRIIAEAAAAAPGSENLFFLPYLTGERCPHADPLAQGAYIGLTPRHGRAELLRATLEGITFGMREQVAILRQMEIPIRQVRASGGGARSAFWRQLQADMYGAPVVTINVAEGAALGAAILAAVGHGSAGGTGGYLSVPQAAKAIIRAKETSRPRKREAALYDHQYEKYRALYPALKNVYRQFGET